MGFSFSTGFVSLILCILGEYSHTYYGFSSDKEWGLHSPLCFQSFASPWWVSSRWSKSERHPRKSPCAPQNSAVPWHQTTTQPHQTRPAGSRHNHLAPALWGPHHLLLQPYAHYKAKTEQFCTVRFSWNWPKSEINSLWKWRVMQNQTTLYLIHFYLLPLTYSYIGLDLENLKHLVKTMHVSSSIKAQKDK